MYRKLLPDHPYRDDDADSMPITNEQVDVLVSWYHRLQTAIHNAQQIADVVDAYGHIQGAAVDVEMEIYGVLSRHGVEL